MALVPKANTNRLFHLLVDAAVHGPSQPPVRGYGYTQLLGSFLLGSNLCLFIEGLGSTSKRLFFI